MTELFSPDYIKPELQEKNGIMFRPLRINDFGKGFCNILSELTSCETNEQKFNEIFNKMYEINKIEQQYFIIIGEDIKSGNIVASGSVIIEKKFIHNGKSVGHIEDIVVSSKYRGIGLGEQLITILKDISHKTCYKVILDCDNKNLGFYNKCGLKKKSLGMAAYF